MEGAGALRASIKNNAAAVHMKRKDWAAARADALAACAAEPGNAKAHFRAGSAAAQLSDWATAKAQLVEAVRLAPADARSSFDYGAEKALQLYAGR